MDSLSLPLKYNYLHSFLQRPYYGNLIKLLQVEHIRTKVLLTLFFFLQSWNVRFFYSRHSITFSEQGSQCSMSSQLYSTLLHWSVCVCLHHLWSIIFAPFPNRRWLIMSQAYLWAHYLCLFVPCDMNTFAKTQIAWIPFDESTVKPSEVSLMGTTWPK